MIAQVDNVFLIHIDSNIPLYYKGVVIYFWDLLFEKFVLMHSKAVWINYSPVMCA